MISQTAEYALRAVVYLASQTGSPRTVAHIAEATHAPERYLAKIMLGLSRAGLVKSKRGLDGGFMLAGKPEELSILAIIGAVDPIRKFAECPLGIESHGRKLCPLHSRLNEAAEMIEKAFDDTKVAELATPPRAAKALCKFPAITAHTP
ncbi:MAG TPA: Rrf2 family transcriptional regulator [Lacipirellula sp.]